MKFNREDFDVAAEGAELSPEQREEFWTALVESEKSEGPFNFAVVAYYLGASIALMGLAWLTVKYFDSFGGIKFATLGTVYAVAFSSIGYHLWFRKGMRIPGGLFFIVAVCMTPLIIIGIQQATGLWQFTAKTDVPLQILNRWNKVAIELGTIVAALVALRFVKFTLLAIPIPICLWGIFYDLSAQALGKADLTSAQARGLSEVFGIGLLIAALLVDKMFKEDYAYWLFLIGLGFFWGAMTSTPDSTELSKFIYCVINLGLLAAGVVLSRGVFLVFGGIGLFIYFWHLADVVFKNSQLFPFVVSIFGLAIVYAGLKYQKHRVSIDALASRLMPWRTQLLRNRDDTPSQRPTQG